MVLLGVESTDARMSVIPAMLAERLGVAQLTFARKVEIGDGTVKIERQTDTGYDVVEAATPVVVSVIEKINEPRYPSFKGIMAAKKKPLTTLTLADAGIEADKVGLAGSGSAVRGVRRAAAEGRRSDRQGRRRRRRQAGRVPRVPEDHLRQEYDDTWLRSSFWSSTSTGHRRRSRSSC